MIYEAHVRGLTMLRDDMRPHERGTFAALADPQIIDHLQRLGITAVELLPIHAFVQDRFLLEKGLRNYWGYNTLGFFAPEPRYLSGRLARRDAHRRAPPACGRHRGHPRRGLQPHRRRQRDRPDAVLARPRQCQLLPAGARTIRATASTTPAPATRVNLSHPRVLQMVMDSLRYWVTSSTSTASASISAPTLGREPHGFDPGSGFFDALRQDPVLSRVKLISEPWDIGPGGYQLGNHPPGFAEWNDRFRDGVRRFWRGDAGQRGELAARLAGSGDLFDHRGAAPGRRSTRRRA